MDSEQAIPPFTLNNGLEIPSVGLGYVLYLMNGIQKGLC